MSGEDYAELGLCTSVPHSKSENVFYKKQSESLKCYCHIKLLNNQNALSIKPIQMHIELWSIKKNVKWLFDFLSCY